MKRIFAVLLAVLLLLAAAGCGNPNKKAIVGTWHAMDGEAVNDYGVGIEFTKDGKLRYGITEDMLKSLAGDEMSNKEWEEAMQGLEMLMKMEYKLKSDTEMEITVSAMLGLAKEKTTVEYELDGDTLTFDGGVFTRVK